jgi:hypothetical protein
MGCGGIWILLVIYSAKDIIYILFIYILLQFSNRQETRINEPASPLLQARDEDQRTIMTRYAKSHIHRLQSWLIHQNKVTMRPYLHDTICKITHTQITVMIDTPEQGYNAAISSWPDMQNHTHTSILLASRRSCCTLSLNKLHLCWWLRELILGLQWDHKAS